MKSEKLAKAKPGPATQQHLDIAEVRDDMVIMKDGTVRAVLLVSSVNFALKAVDEQEAIIQSYITFLNSLDYPLQIVIQSRQMNIENYLDRLRQQEKEIDNELLRAQIRDYLDFIQELVELGEIMQKRFYAVVPYDPAGDETQNFFQRLSAAISPASAAKLSKKEFAQRQEQLTRRVDVIMGELRSMTLEAVRLDTQALIELYYNAYNPDVFAEEKLEDVSQLRIERGASAVREEEE